METHKTVSILVVRDGKILLVRRTGETWHGMWAVPGGHVDEGETVREAAVREASEELEGVVVTDGPDPVFVHDVPPGDRKHPKAHRHRCYNFMGSAKREVRLLSEADDLVWVTPEKARGMNIPAYMKRILEWFIERR